MSKGNQVLQVRVEVEVIDAIIADIKRRNDHSRREIFMMSDWLRAAIDEKLAKGIRSRKGGRVKRFKCFRCGERWTLSEISYVVKPLFGPREYTCTSCVRVELSGN